MRKHGALVSDRSELFQNLIREELPTSIQSRPQTLRVFECYTAVVADLSRVLVHGVIVNSLVRDGTLRPLVKYLSEISF